MTSSANHDTPIRFRGGDNHSACGKSSNLATQQELGLLPGWHQCGHTDSSRAVLYRAPASALSSSEVDGVSVLAANSLRDVNRNRQQNARATRGSRELRNPRKECHFAGTTFLCFQWFRRKFTRHVCHLVGGTIREKYARRMSDLCRLEMRPRGAETEIPRFPLVARDVDPDGIASFQRASGPR